MTFSECFNFRTAKLNLYRPNALPFRRKAKAKANEVLHARYCDTQCVCVIRLVIYLQPIALEAIVAVAGTPMPINRT